MASILSLQTSLSTTTILALTVFLCAVLLYIVKSYRQNNVTGQTFEAKYPPGPPGMPLIGNIITACKEGWLESQVDTYGDMFTFKMGTMPTIYLEGKALKDALNCGNFLSDRAPVPAMYEYFKGRGVVGAPFHGFWKQQRSFMTTVMQSFNLFRSAGQDSSILTEAEKLIQFLQKKEGGGFDPGPILQLATANVVGAFVYGHQFAYDDDRHIELVANMRDCIQSLSYRCISMFFPRFRRFPVIGIQRFFDCYEKLSCQQQVEIEQHKKCLDRNNPKDFIDHFLIEMEKSGGANGFTEDNLQITCVDLFIAGTETSATTITWCILMLILNPEIETKVQQELDAVIPKEQAFVTMSDQKSCPYLQAVINETQRFSSVAPSSMRSATEDTVFRGYRIPKGTFFIANFMNTMLSPKLWDNPKEFKPERFLSKEEPVTLVKQEFLVPFSTGRRNCVGDRLARAELFLFIANIYRNFNVSLPEGSPKPSSTGILRLTRAPESFKVCFVPRQQEKHVDTVCGEQC